MNAGVRLSHIGERPLIPGMGRAGSATQNFVHPIVNNTHLSLAPEVVMSKFKLMLPLVAATALVCTFAVQAAGGRDQAATGPQLAMASVATACQTAGSCENTAVTAPVSSGSEPSNYALLAAGLGVIGFIASRRRQQF